MALGTILGLVLAIARLSKDRLANSFAGLFIWFFRGTPLLVQLIFWYNLSTLFPRLSIAIPFGPTLSRSPKVLQQLSEPEVFGCHAGLATCLLRRQRQNPISGLSGQGIYGRGLPVGRN